MSKSLKIIIPVILVLVVGGAGAGYYYWQNNIKEQPVPIVQQQVNSDNNQVQVEEMDKTTDSDGDGLTNYDEINTYKTDPNKSDTDDDGYNDGDEVKNGYSPILTPEQEKLKNINKIVFYENNVVYATDSDGLNKREIYKISDKENDIRNVFFDLPYNSKKLLIVDYGQKVVLSNGGEIEYRDSYLAKKLTIIDLSTGKIDDIPLLDSYPNIVIDNVIFDVNDSVQLSKIQPLFSSMALYSLSPDGKKILRNKFDSYSSYADGENELDLFEIEKKSWRHLTIDGYIGFSERNLRSAWHSDSKHLYVVNKFLSSGMELMDLDDTYFLYNIDDNTMEVVFRGDVLCKDEHNTSIYYAVPMVVNEDYYGIVCPIINNNSDFGFDVAVYLYNIKNKNKNLIVKNIFNNDDQLVGLDDLAWSLSPDLKKFHYIHDKESIQTDAMYNLENDETQEFVDLANKTPQNNFFSNDSLYTKYVEQNYNKEVNNNFIEKKLFTYNLSSKESYYITSVQQNYDDSEKQIFIGWF